jgi:hypothetical protein
MTLEENVPWLMTSSLEEIEKYGTLDRKKFFGGEKLI